MKAKSIKGKSPEEIQSALQQCMADGYKPTLAMVFMSVKQNRQEVTDLLHQKGIQVFGATSSGEINNNEVLHENISILLMDMNPSYFTIMLEEYKKEDAITVTKRMTQRALKHFNNPSFIISNSINNLSEMYVGEQILFTIAEVGGTGSSVWGGGAGDDLIFRETFVFTNDKESNKAILFLVMDADKILVKGQAATGQKPVGTEKTITKAIGNWILEIDHQPAADFMPKFIGLTLNAEEHADFQPGVIILSLARQKGEPIIRSSMGFNFENKGMAFSGSIKEGDKIRLTLPPDFDVVEEVSNNARRFKEQEMPDADALLMFSCIGRLEAFGPMTADELQGIHSAYNVPMAGFFTYGEYGRASGGNNEYHNMTCCWVALKEKPLTPKGE
jgi:hypothetical protein